MPNTNRCDAAYKKEILLRCYDALAQAGFRRYRKEDVDRPIHDGFQCWVGLNAGLYSDRLEINPFIGLHVPPIMKLYAELEGQKYNRSYATYAVHMGELGSAKNEAAFAFAPKQSDAFVAAEVERLANLYATAGLDYAKSIASYDALLPLLEARVDMLGAYPERVASCLYLMGRVDDAKAFTEDFLTKHPDYFEGFALPFLKMLDNASRVD